MAVLNTSLPRETPFRKRTGGYKLFLKYSFGNWLDCNASRGTRRWGRLGFVEPDGDVWLQTLDSLAGLGLYAAVEVVTGAFPSSAIIGHRGTLIDATRVWPPCSAALFLGLRNPVKAFDKRCASFVGHLNLAW